MLKFDLIDLTVHVYHPFTKKRIASLSFEGDVRTRLGVAISEVSLGISSRLSLNLLLF